MKLVKYEDIQIDTFYVLYNLDEYIKRTIYIFKYNSIIPNGNIRIKIFLTRTTNWINNDEVVFGILNTKFINNDTTNIYELTHDEVLNTILINQI